MRCPACSEYVVVPEPNTTGREETSTAAKDEKKKRKRRKKQKSEKATTAKPPARPIASSTESTQDTPITKVTPPPQKKVPPPPPKVQKPNVIQSVSADFAKKSVAAPDKAAPDAPVVAASIENAEPASSKPETKAPPERAADDSSRPAPQFGAKTTAVPSVAEAWAVEAPPVQEDKRVHEPMFLLDADGYQPDPGKVTSIRWLGLALAALAIIGAAPAHDHLAFIGAPSWAQGILLLTTLQLFYIVWMVTLPDWSTAWVLMIVYASIAALYGFTLAVTSFTPVDRAMILDLTEVRRTAPAWCGAMLLFTFLGSFLCGRFSARWHKAFVLAAAAR